MKRTYLLLFLFCAAFYSCQKSSSNNSLYPTSYKVDGIHDVTLQRQSAGTQTSVQLGLDVTYLGPIQETVTLSVTGLPAGVYLDNSYNPIMTGIPTFNTSINLVDTSAAAGTYPVSLICTGSATGKKTYTFNMVVLPTPDCRTAIAGPYSTCSSPCASGTYTDNVTLDATANSSIVYFHNFLNTGQTVYATVICGSEEFTIPNQTTANGSSFSGSGYYNSSYVEYSGYYNTSGGTSNYCNLTMYR